MSHSQTVETRRRRKRAMKIRAAAAKLAKKVKNRNAKTPAAR